MNVECRGVTPTIVDAMYAMHAKKNKNPQTAL
jgi:hypothetical protein